MGGIYQDALDIAKAIEEKGNRENAHDGHGCVQGTTASSNILPPLLQVLWPCVQLLRMEHHPPCQ